MCKAGAGISRRGSNNPGAGIIGANQEMTRENRFAPMMPQTTKRKAGMAPMTKSGDLNLLTKPAGNYYLPKVCGSSFHSFFKAYMQVRNERPVNLRPHTLVA